MRKIFLIFLWVGITVSTQSLAKVSGLPVFKNYTNEAEIYLLNGKPMVRYHTQLAIYYPSDTSVELMPYYLLSLNSDMELKSLNVYTQLPNRRKVQLEPKDMSKSYGGGDNYFVGDDIEIKLPFRKLQPGCTAYIDYIIDCDDLRYFRPMYFGYFLPAEEIEHTLIYPEDVKVKIFSKNMQAANVQKVQYQKRGKNFIKYSTSDTPEIEFFEDAPSLAHYQPHIIPILSSYEIDGVTHKYLDSVEDLYKYYYSIVFRNGDKTSPELLTIAEDLKSQSPDRQTLLKNTYKWIQNNIRYIAFEAGEGGLIPRAPAEVCQRKFGDCKDMSNLMVKLLKLNDVDASLTWIGTRSIPYTYEELYTMNTDNHMIVAVKNDDNSWLFLDATDPAGIFGLPTPAIQGKQALIAIDSQKYTIATVPVIEKNKNFSEYKLDLRLDSSILKIDAVLNSKGILRGRINSLLRYTNKKESDNFMKNLIDANQNQTELLRSDVVDTEQEVHVTNKYKVGGKVRSVAGYYYVYPYIASILPFGTVTVENRTVPRDIELNRVLRNETSLHMPKGYRVANMPEGFEFRGQSFTYKLDYQKKSDLLILSEELVIDSPELSFSVEDAIKWNQLLTKLKNIYSTPVKLVKK